jgi:hypothetical protein
LFGKKSEPAVARLAPFDFVEVVIERQIVAGEFVSLDFVHSGGLEMTSAYWPVIGTSEIPKLIDCNEAEFHFWIIIGSKRHNILLKTKNVF